MLGIVTTVILLWLMALFGVYIIGVTLAQAIIGSIAILLILWVSIENKLM